MSKSTILIVEENLLHMKLFSDILENQGYKTLQVSDGESAVIMARENNPDLILLDVRLPFKSGFEVVSQLKDEQDLKEIPVIAVTATADALDRDNYLSRGFDEFLPKPIVIPNMLRTIANCITSVPYLKAVI
tara:strand:+ start:596 stop:991 length:396 start_codon:yes stop_codon:yes gene_type:complete